MQNTGLLGPCALAVEEIEKVVGADGAGVFALGYVDQSQRFVVQSIGSSSGLGGQLKQCIGFSSHFKYRRFPTLERAFLKECELYHQFRLQGTMLHPQRPQGTNWQCPVCRSLPGL